MTKFIHRHRDIQQVIKNMIICHYLTCPAVALIVLEFLEKLNENAMVNRQNCKADRGKKIKDHFRLNTKDLETFVTWVNEQQV